MSGAPALMQPADSILWRIERDAVLRSTITAVTLLDRAPDWARLRRRMDEAVDMIPRLRQVVAEPAWPVGSPHWAPAEEFDLDYHLRQLSLPDEPGLGAVLDFAAREAMKGFDHTRPLWEFTLVRGLSGGQAALVEKFHHAVTDGLGGMQLALQVLDASRDAADFVAAVRGADLHAPADGRPLRRATAAARAAAALEADLVRTVVRAGTTPVRSTRELLDAARWAARLLAPTGAPLSPLMLRRSTRLRFAAFDTDLDRLRQAAHHAGGSLNDAFVAAVVAGLRRYHEAQGARVSRLRMTLPVSIRRPGDPLEQNRFTPVRFVVPVLASDDSPALAVQAISAIIRSWREGPALGLSDGLAHLLNALPTEAVSRVFGALLKNVDFVATNVPGLPVPYYLAGAKLVGQYAFAPPSGAALNVALVSHLDRVCVGVNMDPAAVTDTPLMARSLEEGFAEVLDGPTARRSAAHRRPGSPPQAEGAGS
ncbi:MAG TPA: wax ester/triacylglycerol synthase domain-containing protein [Acidimicrobiales bacterium]|nr:wax ester/triacylglycerol synthase domain-containing protein [Acidimicrobiales bacterium]